MRFQQTIPKWTIENYLKAVDLEWKPMHFEKYPVSTPTSKKTTTFTVSPKTPKPEFDITGVIKRIIDDVAKEPLQWINNASTDFSTLKGRVEELHERLDNLDITIKVIENIQVGLRDLLQTHEHMNGIVVAPISKIKL